MCRNWAMTITAAMTLKWRFLKWARVCERNKCGIVILWFTLWENRWIQNHICPLDIAHWNIYISWILTIFELLHSTSIYRLKLTLNMCFCDLICTDWLSLSFSVWFKSLICHCMLTLCLHLQHIHSNTHYTCNLRAQHCYYRLLCYSQLSAYSSSNIYDYFC